ncbi:MAG: EAL domain-containing protein [Actinomycetota bacterium]|nr:EAL domain-containing protein [Actinomycetota bacterium]
MAPAQHQDETGATRTGRVRNGRVAPLLAGAIVVYAVSGLLAPSLTDWTYPATSTAILAAAVAGLRRRPDVVNRVVWQWLVGALALFVVGDWAWLGWFELLGVTPDVSLPDIAYLSGYACLLTAVLLLGRRRFAGRTRSGLVDAVSIGATLLVILWAPLIAPAYSGAPLTHQLVLAAYPVGDVVVLALLGRFAALERPRSGAAGLLLCGAVAFLVADLLYALAIRNGWYDGSFAWLDLGFLVGSACWALALCHPTLDAAAAPVGPEAADDTRVRLGVAATVLAAAALGTAVALAVGERPHVGVLLVSFAVAGGTALWQVHQLVGATMAARSALAESNHELEQQREFFADLVEHASDAVLVIGEDGRILHALGSTTSLYGRTAEEIIGLPGAGLVDPDDLTHLRTLFARLRADPDAVITGECRALRTDGTRQWVSLRVVDRTASSPVGGLVVNVADIGARKEAEAALEHQALHDSLTGLANRTLLHDRLGHALARRGSVVGLLFLDLDRFKIVNDSLGHAAGDLLLVEIARRLGAASRSHDTVARLGGDEFCVVVEDDGADRDLALSRLQASAERILEAVRAPVSLDGVEVVVGTSIGLVVAGPGDTAHNVLRHADLALYAAKSAGKDCTVAYEDEMQRAASDRLALENDLRAAVLADGLHLEYQPIVHLTSGEVVGFEALARWSHPQRGAVPPAAFVPVAEDSGLIVRLGSRVLEQACRDAAHWATLRPGAARGLPVSVNISAVQLRHAELVDSVARALDASGLEPGLLTLELTETAVVHDLKVAAERLGRLKELGVRIAIDDFGTGYSSVGYLEELPIDVLKIDRSFLRPTAHGGLRPVARGVIDLGNRMGLVTVAEGIEHEHQLSELAASGCDLGQGYVFSAPVPFRTATSMAIAGLGTSGSSGAAGPDTSGQLATRRRGAGVTTG